MIKRAPKSATTGNEGRFPHTTQSEKDFAKIRAWLQAKKPAGETAGTAETIRYALEQTARGLP